jgi:hypothetical protein
MNWGHKLTIGMVSFMLFIAFMVFKMTQSKVDLVADNYYESGVSYQQKIQMTKNTLENPNNLMFNWSDSAQILSINISEIKEGSILLYRPSDRKKDFKTILLSQNLIDFKTKDKGLWRVILQWTATNNKVFYSERELFIP